MWKFRSSTSLVSGFFLLASTALGAERPKRQPSEGGEWKVEVSVVASQLAIPTGTARGFVWMQNEGSRKYVGGSTLALHTQKGDLAFAEPSFQLDADEEPKGAKESLPSGGPSQEQLLRTLTTSDLSLLPVRALQFHHMTFESAKHTATKSVKAEGQKVDWTDDRLGATRIAGTSYDEYFSRCVRRFEGTEYEIRDYVFTAEYDSPKNSEHYVAFSRGYRAILHPSLPAADGTRPDGGLLLLVRFSATRLEWDKNMGKGEPVIDAGDEASLAKTGEEWVQDGLLRTLDSDGIGDPFDSPTIAILRAMGSFDAAAAKRVTSMTSPKPLAIIVPLLVEKKLEVDGTKFKRLYSDCDDPVYRTLYAAGAQLGGKGDPSFKEEAAFAASSKDPRVLRAARALASALSDTALVAKIDAALGTKK